MILNDIKIYRYADKTKVDANISLLSSDEAKAKIDDIWWHDATLDGVAVLDERDRHWPWQAIAFKYTQDVMHSFVAVISEEDYAEGAIAYHFNGDSEFEIGRKSVYIDRISTAPRNRPQLVAAPLYRGIGSTLMLWAIRESYAAGYEGRITLESLPTKKTLEFYERKGLIATGRTPSEPNLRRYELPKATALAWLKEEGEVL